MMHIIYFNPLLIIKTTIDLQTLLSVRRLDLKRHWFQSKDLKCNELDAEIPEVKKKSVNMTIKARDWPCICFCFCKLKHCVLHCLYAMYNCLRETEREKRRESEIEKYLFWYIFFYFIVTYKGFERHTATWTNHSYLLVVLIGSLIPTSEWLFLCQNPQLLE